MEEKCEYEFCKYLGKPFDESIYKLKRVDHHIDGNHLNNDPKNLMVVHFGCHSLLHGRKGLFILGKKLSDEHKKRISIANSGKNNSMYGRKHTDEAKMKISITNKERKHNEEARQKMSKSRLGMKFSEQHRKNISNARKGVKHSRETKAKIGRASKGRKHTVESKARNVLSYKMGRSKYQEIKNDLIWDGVKLINVNEIVRRINLSC